MTRSSSRDGEGADTVAPLTLGIRRSAASAFARTSAGSAPTAVSSGPAMPSVCSSSATSRCSGSRAGLAAVDGEPLGGGDGFLRTGGELALHGRGRASSRLTWATGRRPVARVSLGPTARRVESVPLNLPASTCGPVDAGHHGDAGWTLGS